MTNDLVRRVYEQKNRLSKGFTARYNIDRLVYFEVHNTPYAAIQREKNIKHWPRAWKTRLILRDNPTWRDLYDEIAAFSWALPIGRDGRDKPGHDGDRQASDNRRYTVTWVPTSTTRPVGIWK